MILNIYSIWLQSRPRYKMHLYLLTQILVAVGISSVDGISFIEARQKIFQEICEMRQKINDCFNYPHFLKSKQDDEVRKTVESSVDCESAISSLQWHVNAYKSPSDIKEDELAEKAKDAHEKCAILVTNLSALKVGTQITGRNQKILMRNLQFGLDYLRGTSGMKPIVNKIHEYSSILLAELNKLQTGEMLTEEKKKELKGYVQSLVNNLKETDFEIIKGFAIVERIMELKELS